MTPLPPLYVMRHGETEWNVAGRLQGAMDSPLTPRGVDQARAQARVLARLGCAEAQWRVSPQGRAIETATIVRGTPPDPSDLDTRLREIEVGDWTGKDRRTIAQSNPTLFEADGLAWYDHAPGGEGLSALAARVSEFLMSLDRPTVIVTHGITSRVLRCIATDLPWEALDQVGGGQGIIYEVSLGKQILHR